MSRLDRMYERAAKTLFNTMREFVTDLRLYEPEVSNSNFFTDDETVSHKVENVPSREIKGILVNFGTNYKSKLGNEEVSIIVRVSDLTPERVELLWDNAQGDFDMKEGSWDDSKYTDDVEVKSSPDDYSWIEAKGREYDLISYQLNPAYVVFRAVPRNKNNG